jgi:hypothetical protein
VSTTTTTTPRTTTLRSAARRLLSTSAAATIAAVGLVALSAPAYAQPVTAGLKVWVCKYVGTPGDDERLKEGKNPIEVSANSADKPKDGEVFVGDQFADAQGRSVVVQIEGKNPGVGICAEPETLPPPTPPKPGDGAPHTGGEGSDVPVGLVGGGALLVGAALVAAEAERRRRSATHR